MAFSLRDIAHCFPAASEQVEAGLFVLKRTTHVLRQYANAVRASTVLPTLRGQEPEIASASAKMQEDHMLMHRNTAILLPKIVIRIHEIQEEFALNILNQIVAPLGEFWEVSTKQLKAVADVGRKVIEKMNQVKAQLHTDRERCLKLLEDLKVAEKNKKDAAQTPEKKGAMDNAVIAFRKAQSAAHEAFVNFNKSVAAANKHQRQFHEIEMPLVMDDLEKMERKRLTFMREKLSLYAKFHAEMADSIRDLVIPMNKSVPVLSEASDMQLFVANIIDNHGAAEKPSEFEVKLPCTPEQILEGTYEGALAGKEGGGIVWQLKSANECRLCLMAFTLVNRKHHCRQCGALVCQVCSSHKAKVADFTQPVRVCDTCHFKPPASHPKVKIATPTAHTEAAPPPPPPGGDSVFAGPTVLVKALYDYKGQTEEEMAFVVGDDIRVSQATSLNKQDWWWGVNVRTGVSGDFPRNHVGLIADLCVTALFAQKSDQPDYLNFEEGAKITVLTQDDPDWWYGKCDNQTGYFPKAYVALPETS